MEKFLLFIFTIALTSFSQEAPKQTIVTGCRCLDCPYFQPGQKAGIWTAHKATPLYKSPSKSENTASSIAANEKAVALTGELHIIPGELSVTHPHKKMVPGDTVYIINEDADAGAWKVSFNGMEDIEDLSSMVSEKEPCTVPSDKCWAKVVRSMTTEWWVKLQTKNKQTYWTDAIENFDFDRSSCM